MNPWIWRIIIIILAIAFIPLIVSGTATLITSGIHGVGESIMSLFKPLSMGGEDRLEGLIRICLYLISITLLVRLIIRM